MPNKYHNDMTELDYQFIKDNYEKMTIKELMTSLNKCESTIYKAIKKLNLYYEDRSGKVWTETEITYLKQNYLNQTVSELAIHLKRSKKGVQGKLHGLGLRKEETNTKNWTKEDLEFLKNNANSLTYEELSLKLNRSIMAIRGKVTELQLIPDKYKKQRKLKREQIDFIIANYDKMTDSQFAIKFNVSIESIASVRKKFGIKKTGNQVHGPTYIENFVIDELQKNNIEYLYNKPLDGYVPDFQIKGTKLIIEVQGDYFHCNPYCYPQGPKDEIQIKHVLKDYYKKCHFLSNGYTIIYIWEYDINHNPEKIKELIKNISADYGQDSQKSIVN